MLSRKIINYRKRKYTKKHGGAASAPAPDNNSPSSRRSSRLTRQSSRRSSRRTPSPSLSPSPSNTNSNLSSNNSTVIKPPPVSTLHRTLFDSIRGGIKEHALMSKDQSKGISESMFLFATPTKLINDLLFSLYNENLIRTTNKSKSKSMMMSLLELSGESKTVYITLSEEPNSDANFFHKLADLILMLKIILYGQMEASKNYSNLGDKIELVDGEYHLEELKKIM
jgi:hypothetical protein